MAADARFVVRPWLEALVDGALDQPSTRYVLLTGEPGAGKTAFMAWLADQRTEWPRYFIRRDSRTPLNSGDARSLLFAIGHQLAASRPALFRPDKLEVVVNQRLGSVEGSAVGITVDDLRVSPFYETSLRVEQAATTVTGDLTGVSIKSLTTEERFLGLGNLQHLALIDPAKLLLSEDPGARIVILVDALDELRYQPGDDDTALDWLAHAPELPENVRFVLTSRPDDHLLRAFRDGQRPWLRTLSIDTESGAVKRDLERYAANFTADTAIGRALGARGITAEDLAARADGNFQYLTTLAAAIEHARGAELDRLLERLPTGLADLYGFFLALIRDAVGQEHIEVRGPGLGERILVDAWQALLLPVLGLLAVAQDALTTEQIERLSGTQGRGAVAALERLAQFLDETEDGRLRLYHATFREYLRDTLIDQADADERLAGAYKGDREWADVDWSAADGYGLLHLAVHLLHLPEELHALLCAPFMREKRRRFGSHTAFAADVRLALGARSTTPQRLRCHLILASLTSVAGDAPVDALGLLARLGQGKRAAGLARLRRNTFGAAATAYVEVIEGMLEAGDGEHARELLDEASRLTREAPLAPAARLAAAAIRLDRTDRALELLDELPPDARVEALGELAPLLPAATIRTQAAAAAEGLDLPARSCRALAVAYRHAGEPEQASRYAELAVVQARQPHAQADAAHALAAAGHCARALALGRELAGEDATLARALRTYCDVAIAGPERVRSEAQRLADAGDFQGALQALDAILERRETVPRTSLELAALARVAAALASPRLVDDLTGRIGADPLPLAELAAGLAAIGRPQDAKRTALAAVKAASSTVHESQQLAAACAACATAACVLQGLGEPKAAARAYARARNAPGIRYREWGAVAAAAVAVGARAEAASLAEELISRAVLARDGAGEVVSGRAARAPGRRHGLERGARLFGEAAVALAALGDRARALEAAGETVDLAVDPVPDRWRLYALARATFAFASIGERDRARATLVRATDISARVGRQFYFECLGLGVDALDHDELATLATTLADLDSWWNP